MTDILNGAVVKLELPTCMIQGGIEGVTSFLNQIDSLISCQGSYQEDIKSLRSENERLLEENKGVKELTAQMKAEVFNKDQEVRRLSEENEKLANLPSNEEVNRLKLALERASEEITIKDKDTREVKNLQEIVNGYRINFDKWSKEKERMTCQILDLQKKNHFLEVKLNNVSKVRKCPAKRNKK